MAASKNSRTSRSGTAGPVQQSGEQKVIIPLNSGKHAYVTVPGKTLHLATDSEAFVTAIAALGEEKTSKVRYDLERLHEAHPTHGWDATLSRLESAGAL